MATDKPVVVLWHNWLFITYILKQFCYFFISRMATDEEEVVLCTIKIDASGVLSIHPDFNRGRKAYIAETKKDYARGKISSQ